MILAGDIGGTKTNLAFMEADLNHPRQLNSVVEASYPSREHADLEEVVLDFLARHDLRASAACFGVAGPVERGRCHAVNLPWVVDERQLAVRLRIERVHVINDLEATAYALPVLGSEELVELYPGATDAVGNRAVIAAGTGLGQAGMYWDGRRHRPFACEGGHSDFSPRTELECRLLAFLADRFGYVDCERAISGPGVRNLFDFLVSSGELQPNPTVLERFETEDPSAVIGGAALDGSCPACVATLELFVELYGAEAGNLALKLMATGGIYVGGGIAPKIRPLLTDGRFIAAFLAKGRLRPVLEKIPVRLILTNRAAVIGAARFALLREDA